MWKNSACFSKTLGQINYNSSFVYSSLTK
jgi:hypothetical protein